MPVQPLGGAVEPLMEAVDGARYVKWDRHHRLLFVGRLTSNGFAVLSYDVVTGAEHDAPWPVDIEVIESVGFDVAFQVAIGERMARGY